MRINIHGEAERVLLELVNEMGLSPTTLFVNYIFKLEKLTKAQREEVANEIKERGQRCKD